jgi:hypothetical protein
MDTIQFNRRGLATSVEFLYQQALLAKDPRSLLGYSLPIPQAARLDNKFVVPNISEFYLLRRRPSEAHSFLHGCSAERARRQDAHHRHPLRVFL